jgi:hypothetical protein
VVTHAADEIFKWFFDDIQEAQHEIVGLQNLAFDPAMAEKLAVGMVEDGFHPTSDLYKTCIEREEEHNETIAFMIQTEQLRIMKCTQLSQELAGGMITNCIAFFEDRVSTGTIFLDLLSRMTGGLKTREQMCAEIAQFRKFIRILSAIAESTNPVTH